jgi:hypothetical protein
MADYYINIVLDDEKLKKIADAGLADQVKEIEGKKIIQVDVNQKEYKKISKGFPDITPDSSNAFVLPEGAENILMGFITNMKTLDVMKAAIMKLYSPLAGKEIRTRIH